MTRSAPRLRSLAALGPAARQLLPEEGLRYLVVGAWNTLSSYLLFVVLELSFGDDVGYMVLLVTTMVVSVLQAFVLYRRWVFRDRSPWLPALMRFVLVYASAFAVNLALLPVLVEVVRLPVLLAQALLVFTTVTVSFFGHRSFSFRGR